MKTHLKGVNVENLNKIADYAETIPKTVFDMNDWRSSNHFSHECNSAGCVIGFSTILDDYENIPRHSTGTINFRLWSEKFTGLSFLDDRWTFLFGADWRRSDNSPIGAARRIRYFIEHGLPDNWEDMIDGVAPFPY